MRAIVLDAPGEPLRERELPDPEPGPGEVVVAVEACGVCRTDLHVIDGELPDPALPLILGHQAVGRVVAVGAGASLEHGQRVGAEASLEVGQRVGAEASLEVGQRVGVPWLAWTCGDCDRCREGRENLCPRARFHGYTRDGGYAERVAVDSRFALPLTTDSDASALAPLLCAGLIGYRALGMCAGAERVGLFGFGSSAHLICALLVKQGREPYAFTRDGDAESQRFARSLGAVWAGGSSERPPVELDAAIIFAPAGELVPAALTRIRPGGIVVCAGIHMSDIPSFPYELLWHERSIRSVANLTRRDGLEFLPLAIERGLTATVTTYPLRDASRALDDLRAGRVEGSAVLEMGSDPV